MKSFPVRANEQYPYQGRIYSFRPIYRLGVIETYRLFSKPIFKWYNPLTWAQWWRYEYV